MSSPYDFMLNISRRSPGLVLVAIGAILIFNLFGYTPIEGETPTPIYLGYGFGVLVALAGIFLLFSSEKGTQIAVSPSDATDLQHAVRQLSQNYDVLRRQATSGFILAGTFMALGIGVILVGAVGELFGLTKEGSNLTTIAGVVVEAISGLGLYLFNQTFNQLNLTSENLHQTWKILTAFEKAEALPEEQKTVVVASLIGKLVETEQKPNKGLQSTPKPAAPFGRSGSGDG